MGNVFSKKCYICDSKVKLIMIQTKKIDYNQWDIHTYECVECGEKEDFRRPNKDNIQKFWMAPKI